MLLTHKSRLFPVSFINFSCVTMCQLHSIILTVHLYSMSIQACCKYWFFSHRQSVDMLVRVDLVPDLVEGAEEPRWWNDSEKTSNVHNAVRTPWVFRTEHASGKDELHRKESRTFGDEQQQRQQNGMGNNFDYHIWNNECLLGLNVRIND